MGCVNTERRARHGFTKAPNWDVEIWAVRGLVSELKMREIVHRKLDTNVVHLK